MARRGNSSLLEELLDISCLLSWQMNLAIAATSYFILHYLAQMQPSKAASIDKMSDVVFQQLTITLASIFQYVIPSIFVVGAIVSMIRRRKREKLLQSQSGIESIRMLSWQEFELLVGQAYRLQGYRVEENGGGGADGGIDLTLYKDQQKLIVQCKRWKNYSIGVNLVRELFGVMTAVQANGCIFVTSGSYTSEARIFASEKPIELIDGLALVRLIGSVREMDAQPIKISSTPICPQCSSPMIRRVARKGSNTGNEFWGCSKYPSCRGTRQ